jgi:flagellar operon protein
MIGPKGPQLSGTVPERPGRAESQQNGLSFNDLFNQMLTTPQTDSIRLSAHAQKRLSDRNIVMSPELESSLVNAVDKLSARGAKDSLVITDEGAFLINVPSRTMVTAMGKDEMRDGIVTNIDSVSMKYS